jgi:hypothetical protein
VWYAFAALVPLPLIGLAYVAAVPTTVALEVELYLAGKGSTHIVKRSAAAAIPAELPRATASLFTSGHKGPRADHYAASLAVTDAGKQLISANLAGGPAFTRPPVLTNAVSRAGKADRLKPTTTNVALKGPDSTLFMNASYSPFDSFNVDAFRPSPEEIAYHPNAEALRFDSLADADAVARVRREHGERYGGECRNRGGWV